MSNAVFISTIEANSGKSLISLGLMELLLKKTQKIGYFKPIIKGNPNRKDHHTQLILDYFALNQNYEDTYVFTGNQVNKMLGDSQFDLVIDQILDHYKKLEKQYDFILIEGTDFVGENIAFEFELNAAIAKNLGSPILIVATGQNKTPEEAASTLKFALDSFEEEETEVIGAILNRVEEEKIQDYKTNLKKKLGGTGKNKELAVIPNNDILSSPSVAEITEELNAKVLFGEELLHQKIVHRYSVAGMTLANYLTFLTENCAVVASADRAEIIMGSLQAHQSTTYPNLSAIILTGGFDLPEPIYKLLKGLTATIPILKVTPNTFQTTINLNNVKSNLSMDNPNKIALALKYFDQQIDTTNLENKIIGVKPRGMTPKMFKYNLNQTALAQKMHIVLPEGNDDRILKAAEQLQAMKLVNLTLLYRNPDEVTQKIQDLGLDIDLDEINIVAPAQSPNFNKYVSQLYEYRKEKGITMEIAEDLMNDVSYFGTMMVQQGDADGMVSGAVNTTQHTIRPALQFVKTKPGIKVVSSVFFMCLDNRVLVYGDCAVNPNPTAEQLAEIAVSSAYTAMAFGVEARVAMLSYSSGASGKGEEVEKVRKATALAKELAPELMIEGPIQYDAAVDPEVGKKKMPDSQVAGQATVLIFPDLNTGNNTYKAVQRETGAIAIGPVLQGLNKPVNDLSRGCTVEDIVNTVVITAIQSQKK
ncbi:phosphate acetyltransferase [Gilvimarinus agarilyticus]|uniref:phosphate acetyltransferase n=1 Tax=Reichenbachiella TaxID=156993 RepID=UPI000E6D22C4|nr:MULTISPECIES: phosphate acetyltransferase [Reichenbachiella]MBU2884930.1 phosphate acetyltransferase [Gilvimarinus agarilyticus]MBU2913690.1 phosphate acetyltransferase [Reichenbachiella agariperforans]RJE74361.1 phosphate acetyltransferase [Reichenbachiella sp. MSK19-1]